MKSKRKVCWNITARCNQNCLYCHRFLNVRELNYEENKQILDNLIRDGVTHITWTGGEALLYPDLYKLIKFSKENGVYNRVITNGKLLVDNYDVLNYLSDLTISLDSIRPQTNLKLGRGEKHFENIKNILDYIQNGKYKKLKVNVNTVVNKQNINEIKELGEFLNQYKIGIWKLYNFIPLRETAQKNRQLFEITESEFDNAFQEVYEKYENINNIVSKKQKELEKDVLIIADGSIIKTEKGIDFLLGNALTNNVIKYINEDINVIGDDLMNKIKTLIAYDDEETQNKIYNILKEISDVEIVATTKNPEDTYKKIIEFKPEMVFSKYDFGTDMNGLDIIKKSKEVLKEDVPAFNFIALNIPQEDFLEAKRMIGDKMNTVIREHNPVRYTGIIQDYKEYINSKF